ncbi:MAG: Ig-like domain-containing protein [Lachnospiraceae bacterium]|nr:Ig-like domain-containing protein [Lachnospiraceae bacterium]
MNRRKMMAGLLALSLAVPGMPVTAVRAAEYGMTGQETAAQEGTEEPAAWEGAEETPRNEEEAGSAGVYTEALQALGNSRMAGTDGILYDGVAYLSTRNVLAMDGEMQEAYRALCDDIAAAKAEGSGLQDVVLAADADGNLYCSYYIPMRTLGTVQEAFLTDAGEAMEPEGTPAGGGADGQVRENPADGAKRQEGSGFPAGVPADSMETLDRDTVAGNEDTEAGAEDSDAPGDEDSADAAVDEPDGEETAGNEGTEAGAEDSYAPEDEDSADAAADEPDGEKTADNEGTEAGAEDSDASGDEDSADAAADEPDGEETAGNAGTEAGAEDSDALGDEDSTDAAADEPGGEETADEETADMDAAEDVSIDAEETTEGADPSAEDGDAGAVPGAIFEENMDAIVSPEEETFEIPEAVRLYDMPDLGYGVMSDHAGGVQVYSILPKEGYFQSQLNAAQKKYYKAAKEKLTTGSNQFSFQETLSAKESVAANVPHAISALILEYPEKTDWMAKPGGIRGVVSYKKKAKKGTYTYTVDMSPFYSGGLDAQANAKVQEVGSAALQYASERYPDAPAYGIVEYFDQWLCGNGYYGGAGGEGTAETNYYSHSAYGVLLRGYGVCEGYTKAMARLLDAAGIPNIYVSGSAGGSLHTWNYIQMPDGAWYVQDSTWNDTADVSHTVSTGEYLLTGDNGSHVPSGCNYDGEPSDFRFPDRSGAGYAYEAFTLDKGMLDMVAKETIRLNKSKDVTGYWTSSNAKVAKVDKNGKVTAVSGGTAVITFAGSGMTASCEINVDQIKSLKTADTKKTSGSLSLGIAAAQGGAASKGSAAGQEEDSESGKESAASKESEAGKESETDKESAAGQEGDSESSKESAAGKESEAGKEKEADKVSATGKDDSGNADSKDILLTVDMGASPHTAQWLVSQNKVSAPEAASSKPDIATATTTLVDNTITVHVQSKQAGTSNVTVKFGGKTVKLKVSAGEVITKDMFDVTWPAAMTGEDGNRTIAYTGKAVKPVIKKKTDDIYKPVKYKVSYSNNTNAGTAKVVVTGTGKYGGTLEYPFTIMPLDIADADFSKALKNKTYNGGSNPPAATVKLGKKTLKVNKDYEILYSGNESGESDGASLQEKTDGSGTPQKEALSYVPAGSYTITVRGIGNYTGEAKTTQTYQVTPNTIAKVTVSGAGSAKHTGIPQKPYTVKIGKNVLPSTDYTITWYLGQGKTKRDTPMVTAPIAKGKYTAVITVQGGNLTTTTKKKEIVKKFTIK